MEYIYDYYEKEWIISVCVRNQGAFELFSDLIAYRIVISMPRCHMKQKQDRKKEESGIYIGLPMYCHNFWKNVDLRQSRQVGLKEVILYYWMMLCAHITGIILMGKVQIHIVRFI